MNGADASKTLSPKNVLLRFSARVFVCPISLADKDEIEDPWPKSRNPQYVAAASCMRGKAAARIPSLPSPSLAPSNPWEFLFSFHRRRRCRTIDGRADGGRGESPPSPCCSLCPSTAAGFVKAICSRGIVRFSFRFSPAACPVPPPAPVMSC